MAAGVYAFVRTQFLLWILLAIAGVAIFGAVYLYEYSQLPGPPGWFSTGPERPAPATSVSTPTTPTTSPEPESPGTAPENLPVAADPEDLDPDYDPVADADAADSSAPRAPPPDP